MYLLALMRLSQPCSLAVIHLHNNNLRF